MKKLLTAVVLLCTIFTAAAQEHLTFKGVPIDGTMNEFVSKLKQKGFTYLGDFEGTAIIEGDFAAHKNCTVCVVALESTKKVNTVIVAFPNADTWDQLDMTYSQLKEWLTQKYGEPSICEEFFQSSMVEDSDIYKLHELKMDKCTYYTLYDTEKGQIKLSIISSDMRCFVKLQYWDRINTNAIRHQAIDDL